MRVHADCVSTNSIFMSLFVAPSAMIMSWKPKNCPTEVTKHGTWSLLERVQLWKRRSVLPWGFYFRGCWSDCLPWSCSPHLFRPRLCKHIWHVYQKSFEYCRSFLIATKLENEFECVCTYASASSELEWNMAYSYEHMYVFSLRELKVVWKYSALTISSLNLCTFTSCSTLSESSELKHTTLAPSASSCRRCRVRVCSLTALRWERSSVPSPHCAPRWEVARTMDSDDLCLPTRTLLFSKGRRGRY